MHNLPQLADKFRTASMAYCARNNIEFTDDWILMKLQEEVGELFQAWLMKTGRARDKGHTKQVLEEQLAAETADALGMIMVFISSQNIDINKYIEKKWNFKPNE